jgi:serine/threonine-protein kinase PRP4
MSSHKRRHTSSRDDYDRNKRRHVDDRDRDHERQHSRDDRDRDRGRDHSNHHSRSDRRLVSYGEVESSASGYNDQYPRRDSGRDRYRSNNRDHGGYGNDHSNGYGGGRGYGYGGGGRGRGRGRGGRGGYGSGYGRGRGRSGRGGRGGRSNSRVVVVDVGSQSQTKAEIELAKRKETAVADEPHMPQLTDLNDPLNTLDKDIDDAEYTRRVEEQMQALEESDQQPEESVEERRKRRRAELKKRLEEEQKQEQAERLKYQEEQLQRMKSVSSNAPTSAPGPAVAKRSTSTADSVVSQMQIVTTPAASEDSITPSANDERLAVNIDTDDHKDRHAVAQMRQHFSHSASAIHAPVAASPRADSSATNDTDDNDMFDMFSDSPSKIIADTATALSANSTSTSSRVQSTAETRRDDELTDADGYYKIRRGDMLLERYMVLAFQGRGVFSTVLRVRDIKSDDEQSELVIKVMRNQETMTKAGLKEVEYLNILSKRDPNNRQHVIRMLSHFFHGEHLCLVFEPMNRNLREVLKKFGSVGLNLEAVRSFARQLFVALRHLQQCNILHGDIKPDNILVDDSMQVIKVCDFGTAGFIDECEITPLLVSRFYRAPEIMLGCPYDEMVDMWSVGCVLFELYTAQVLFPGADNNDMLRRIQQAKGGISHKMVRKGQFSSEHFDLESGEFLSSRTDTHSGLMLVDKIRFTKPTHSIRNMCMAHASDSDHKEAVLLADLLDKIFMINPRARITVDQALLHPFIRGYKNDKEKSKQKQSQSIAV